MSKPRGPFRGGRSYPQALRGGGRGSKWSSWSRTSAGAGPQAPQAERDTGTSAAAGPRHSGAAATSAPAKPGKKQWVRNQAQPTASPKTEVTAQSKHKKWVRPSSTPAIVGGAVSSSLPQTGATGAAAEKPLPANVKHLHGTSHKSSGLSQHPSVVIQGQDEGQPSVPYVKQRHNTLALQSAKQLPKPEVDLAALQRRQQSKGRVHLLGPSHPKATGLKKHSKAAAGAKTNKHKVWQRNRPSAEGFSAQVSVAATNGNYKRSGNGNKLIRRSSSVASNGALGAQAARSAALQLKLRGAASARKLLLPRRANLSTKYQARNSTQGQQGSTSRCTKLKRIGDHLYKVEGTGPGQTLTRQTSETLTTAAATANAKRIASAASAAVTAQVKARVLAQVASAKHSLKRQAPATGGKLLSALKSAKRARQTSKEGTVQRRPCPVFCRTGKCKKAKEGACKMIHDPSKVAVCIPWLNGTCTNAKCKKQHKVCPELMPVCAYYLQGMCSKDNCPYLHVNLDPAAPICQAFSRGYCPKGKDCPMKHFSQQQIDELRIKAGRPCAASDIPEKSRRNKTLVRKADDAEKGRARSAKRRRGNSTGTGHDSESTTKAKLDLQQSEGGLAGNLLIASSSLIPSFLKEMDAEMQRE